MCLLQKWSVKGTLPCVGVNCVRSDATIALRLQTRVAPTPVVHASQRYPLGPSFHSFLTYMFPSVFMWCCPHRPRLPRAGLRLVLCLYRFRFRIQIRFAQRLESRDLTFYRSTGANRVYILRFVARVPLPPIPLVLQLAFE